MSDIFKEIIPSIQQTKKVVVTAENERDYVPFVVNRALSYHVDCIMQANQMNMLPSAENLLQYHYLFNSVRKYKRPFQSWQNRVDPKNLNIVKEYYGYSNEKAKEALNILSDADIAYIKAQLDTGGVKRK